MADVRVQVPAPAVSDAANQAKFICGGLTVALPWWPDEIAWASLAQSWSEQQRPGRAPLLLKDAQTMPEISLGFILANRDTIFVGDGGSVLPIMQNLDSMAKSDIPVQLMLATRDAGRFRITDLSVTELEHDANGQPVRAEVSMTIKRSSDAAAPIGPVSARKKKKGRR